MLLRHTPKEITERAALTINPAKTCQPIGAMYAALGIHGCLPHSHGSQGCCAYHRSTLTRHYKEPISAATSSFTEGASVFGGQANSLTPILKVDNAHDPDEDVLTYGFEVYRDQVLSQVVTSVSGRPSSTVPASMALIASSPGLIRRSAMILPR